MNTRPSTTVRSPQRSGGGNRGFLIGLAVLVVAAIVIGGILLSGGGDDDEPTPVNGTEAVADDGGSGGEASDDTGAAPDSTVAQYGAVTVTGDNLPRFQPDLEDPAVASPAPTLTGNDFAGNEVVIGGVTDRPTMVLFLAHWCPHCNAEVDRLVQYLADNGAPQGVRVALVATGSERTAPNWPPSQWLIDKGISGFDVIADSEVQTAAAAYGLSSYPFIVQLAPDGTVIERRSGEQADGFFDEAFASLASAA